MKKYLNWGGGVSKRLIVIIISVLLIAITLSYAYFASTNTLENIDNTLEEQTATLDGTVLKLEGKRLNTDNKLLTPGSKELIELKATAIDDNDEIFFKLIYEGINTFEYDIKYTVYKVNEELTDLEIKCEDKTKTTILEQQIYKECHITNLEDKIEEYASGALNKTNEIKEQEILSQEKITGSKEGTSIYYYIVIEYVNTAGDQSVDYSHKYDGKFKFVIINDAEPPSDPVIAMGEEGTLTFGGSEDNQGEVFYYYSIGCAEDNYIEGTSIPFTEETTDVCIYAVDKVGNRSSIIKRQLMVNLAEDVETKDKYYCSQDGRYYDTLEEASKACEYTGKTSYSCDSGATHQEGNTCPYEYDATSYCNEGETQESGACKSTYGATPNCDTGYSLVDGKCQRTYPATRNCPSGTWNANTSKCENTYTATRNCPSGTSWNASASKCQKTYDGTTKYTCTSGTPSGANCLTTYTASNCPSGYTSTGTRCQQKVGDATENYLGLSGNHVLTSTYPCAGNPSSKSLTQNCSQICEALEMSIDSSGSTNNCTCKKTYGTSATCRSKCGAGNQCIYTNGQYQCKKTILPQSTVPYPYCEQCSYQSQTTQLTYGQPCESKYSGSHTNGTTNYTIPTYTGTCTGEKTGTVTYQDKCYNYVCSTGTLSGSSCYNYSDYTCNSGDTKSGTTCTHSALASVSYTCTAGDSGGGTSKTCTHSADATYSCTSGDSLSSQTCTHKVDATYSCNGSDSLSSQTCTNKVNPTYSCSNNDALSSTTCTHTNPLNYKCNGSDQRNNTKCTGYNPAQVDYYCEKSSSYQSSNVCKIPTSNGYYCSVTARTYDTLEEAKSACHDYCSEGSLYNGKCYNLSA